MSQLVMVRHRSSRDVVIGALLAIGGLVILGNAVIATRVSIVFLGWMIIGAGVVELVSALANLGRGGFWSPAIAGGFSVALGLMLLRHTEAAALTLTLIAGALLLAIGIARLVASVGGGDFRWPLIVSGVAATVLGLIVLLKVFDASYALLGVLLGLQTLFEGIAIMLIGRVTIAARSPDTTTSAT